MAQNFARRLSHQISNLPGILLSNRQNSVGQPNHRRNVGFNSIIQFRRRPTLAIGSDSVDLPAGDKEKQQNDNAELTERTIQFMSIVYALLLIITGGMCSFSKITKPKNPPRDAFVTIISVLGFFAVLFLHWDIKRFKRVALAKVTPIVRRQSVFHLQPEIHDNDENEENSSGSGAIPQPPAYDSVSLNTAWIFDCYQDDEIENESTPEPVIHSPPQMATRSDSVISNGSRNKTGYRYFQGKHSNDFYLKIGMMVFCLGSMIHIGIDVTKNAFFYFRQDEECQNGSLLIMDCIRLIFSFYQLYFLFKYSNIIINRRKNMARFVLMHLVGTSISCWMDTIIDDAIEDFIENKLELFHHHNNGTGFNSSFLIDQDDYGFREHILYQESCSRRAIISNSSMNALPYLYPFTIEFNIILASIWYMVWSNIGKIHDESLFSKSYEMEVRRRSQLPVLTHRDSDSEGINPWLSAETSRFKIDCHHSSRGLFIGLATLLLIIITTILFFSTIHNDVSSHLGVVIYTIQILVLTIFCALLLPFAHYKMRQLDVVDAAHRNNGFMMMEDILILIPLPFYFVHYAISGLASAFMAQDDDSLITTNNMMMVMIDILSIVQVLLQSPFIVNHLRRCSNNPKTQREKPGRELIILMLILNVALWILNTFELKSVEMYHASHRYFGDFFSMVFSHTTLPMMLFYRFHSSVCLSHIWKYAYEKDEY